EIIDHPLTILAPAFGIGVGAGGTQPGEHLGVARPYAMILLSVRSEALLHCERDDHLFVAAPPLKRVLGPLRGFEQQRVARFASQLGGLPQGQRLPEELPRLLEVPTLERNLELANQPGLERSARRRSLGRVGVECVERGTRGGILLFRLYARPRRN